MQTSVTCKQEDSAPELLGADFGEQLVCCDSFS